MLDPLFFRSHNVDMRIFYMCLLILSVGFPHARSYAYNFLFTSHNKNEVAVVGAGAEIVWKCSAIHPQRADMSKDGKFIFVSERNGAKMVDVKSKKALWKYQCPEVSWHGVETAKLKKGDKVQLENPVAQILGEDRFLVGNEGLSVLLEINSKGEVLKSIKCESLNKVKHGEFRLASKTREGTYLIPMTASGLILEYAGDGRQILRIKKEGPVGAARMRDGNILAGGHFGVSIFDRSGKEIWNFSAQDLRRASGAREKIVICDVKELDGGNILCTTYAGANMPDAMEISKDRKIVKIYDWPEYTHLSAIQILDEDFKALE